MTFDSIVNSIPEWLKVEGPESGMVISSRLRLARNIAGIPYAHRSDDEKLGEIIDNVLDTVHIAGFDSANFFRIDSLDELHKTVFIERHLISPALAFKEGNCGVLVGEGENNSILINEEDHLRLQVIKAGLNLDKAYQVIDGMDNALEEDLDYAYHPRWGYLTACPTNVGTGIRCSVMMHLPGLVLSRQMQRILAGVQELGLAVRGIQGEGSEVAGGIFQISNQATLGVTERETIETIERETRKISRFEKEAREQLRRDSLALVEDRVFRALGTLKTARILSSKEVTEHLSALRFGIATELVKGISFRDINEMLICTRPAHIQKHVGKPLDSEERDIARASLLRERLN